MENIVDNLKDPSWWFTAFFIAIIASVVAGFLKDRIANAFGGLSENMRARKARNRERQELVIGALLNNEAYLNIALFRGIVSLILFAISVVLYSGAPVLLSMVPQEESTSEIFDKGLMVWGVFMPILGVFSMIIGFKSASRMSLLFKTIKRYRETHNLPKIP